MYTIHNKKLGRDLKHPAVGLWYTPSLEEAKEMLAACRQYLEADGRGEMAEQVVITDVETGEEV